MSKQDIEHTLAFLLDFDGRVHWYTGGYWAKFEIRRVDATAQRPHGLSYSFTLHGPANERLIGFDNAHAVAPPGGRHGPLAPDGERSGTTVCVQGRRNID